MQTMINRQLLKAPRVTIGMAASDHLDSSSAQCLEFVEQGPLPQSAQPIPSRVGQHGHTASTPYGTHRRRQACPLMRLITWLARREITLKNLVHIRTQAPLHQGTGDVGTTDEVRIAGMGLRIGMNVRQTMRHEAIGHRPSARLAASGDRFQQTGQARVIQPKSKAHHMQGLAAPGDRDLHTGHAVKVKIPGRRHGILLTRQRIVIGQGHDAHAVARCTLDQFVGRKRPIRSCRMGMQINVDIMRIMNRHPAIVLQISGGMVKTRIMPIYAIGEQQPVIHPSVFIADSATVIGQVELAEHSSLWWGATLRGDNTLIRIGARSNVQEGAVIHTDLGHQALIGEGVTVGHQAMLHGCTIGDGSLIGIQAVVLNGAQVGENCLIGACALVTAGMVIPAGSMVLGSPARIVRPLNEAQLAEMRLAAETYVQRSASFRLRLRRIDHA